MREELAAAGASDRALLTQETGRRDAVRALGAAAAAMLATQTLGAIDASAADKKNSNGRHTSARNRNKNGKTKPDTSGGPASPDDSANTGDAGEALDGAAMDGDGLVTAEKKGKAGPTGPTGPTGAAGIRSTAANTFAGTSAGGNTTTGNFNTAVGSEALFANTTGNFNTAVGREALRNATASSNTAVGQAALQANTTGSGNTAVGRDALHDNTLGPSNTAIGQSALRSNTIGTLNTAVGAGALIINTSGNTNTALGNGTLSHNTVGADNTAVGESALRDNTTGNRNTALGIQALISTNFTNTTGVGANSEVTGDNQVQLGDSATNTYYYNSIQARSDLRDKADVRDTALGLDFITALRPVDFRWDLREDYRPPMPDAPGPEVDYAAQAAYAGKLEQWRGANKLANIHHDGSKTRGRYHHGLIAQEVADVIARTGIDFGGYQDHTVKGGDDVRSLGYEELIAPLIKAVQELAAENAQIRARLAAIEASPAG